MPRILTYNVHRCVGVDRKLDVGRIAAVIAELRPDIVALQELDVGRARTGGVDQAREIAKRLEMTVHFHPAMKVEEELYGDAILTTYPERLIHADKLPGYPRIQGLEPRGAIWICVEIDGRHVQVINTHLGLVPREQQIQAAAIAGPRWLAHPDCAGATILLGDFNAGPTSVVYRTLSHKLKAARRQALRRSPSPTFPSRMPVQRFDHVFVSDQIVVKEIFAPYTPLTRIASDHLPLVVDFDVVQVA